VISIEVLRAEGVQVHPDTKRVGRPTLPDGLVDAHNLARLVIGDVSVRVELGFVTVAAGIDPNHLHLIAVTHVKVLR
jgi:hypothetical protein